MSPTPTARPGGRAAAPRRLLVINLWACLLLLAQYLLGMVANLYVTIPAQHPGASAGNYFGGAASGIGWVIPDGPAWLAAHAALGLALVVAALAAVVWQRGSGSRLIMFTSVLGAGDPGRGVQRSELPELRPVVQLDDHGRAVGAGPGLLRGRSVRRRSGR
jgi:hypothetical protein